MNKRRGFPLLRSAGLSAFAYEPAGMILTPTGGLASPPRLDEHKISGLYPSALPLSCGWRALSKELFNGQIPFYCRNTCERPQDFLSAAFLGRILEIRRYSTKNFQRLLMGSGDVPAPEHSVVSARERSNPHDSSRFVNNRFGRAVDSDSWEHRTPVFSVSDVDESFTIDETREPACIQPFV